ncbi:MAG: Nif3-like dinuclear metal center hexameric protein [Burkholderiaceae bacterium]|nr:Nif3-like dinuclear metal center hexameric protein [Burkholderiaceae bacterium]
MNSSSSPTGVERARLTTAFDALLHPEQFHDYGPNGLQVEGQPRVRKLVSGVTACRALIDAAINAGADAIVVHHGLFWRGQSGTVTGWMKQRLARLLAHDINLWAYHLPLDAQPEIGNNAQLARLLGLVTDGHFGEYELGCIGARADGGAFADADELAHTVTQVLGRAPLVVGAAPQPIRRLAWCSGGAQDWFEAAIGAGAQAFITGEISEPQAHLARECGVVFLACGHHATERYGAPALAAQVAGELGLEHQFIDIENPA